MYVEDDNLIVFSAFSYNLTYSTFFYSFYKGSNPNNFY